MSIISDYWFSSQAGGPGPGPDPFIIGQSLRFRGQQFLINESLVGQPAHSPWLLDEDHDDPSGCWGNLLCKYWDQRWLLFHTTVSSESIPWWLY